jgi:hypothetical protein
VKAHLSGGSEKSPGDANHGSRVEHGSIVPATNPDVIVTCGDQTTMFEPRNRRVSEWLHRRCGLATEHLSGDTEILVHPRKCQSIIAELKAAGFAVANEGEA